MSLHELFEKVKLRSHTLYTVLFSAVIASIFFAIGRLSVLESRHLPIRIQTQIESQLVESSTETPDTVSVSGVGQSASAVESGAVIGSKSGKKYYFPWCGTVKRIKPENQVHFASIDSARATGFTAGGNCKGLK